MNERKIKAAIYTLGCKVNSYESRAIAEYLEKHGIEVCENGEGADICIINTCAVTSEAERKSRQMVRRMSSHSPGAYIIVTGCSAQLCPEKFLDIPEVSAVCGNREKLKCAELALTYAEKIRESSDFPEKERIICSCDLENAPFEKMEISSSERTRAVIKIEDGCESKCAYCIIPSLRGKIRSKAKGDVISEAKALSEVGYREIVLAGIEVSAYGKDFSEKDGLISLIEELSKIPKIERIRLGSLDISAINEDFIERASKIPSFAHHFHLSLQSGCNKTLFAMRRRYNVETVKKRVDYIREKMPDAMFTGDIIVGFPGETDEDFRETADFLESLGLLSCHIFAYSKRPGTPAAEMENQVPPDIKASRLKALEKILAAKSNEILKNVLGQNLEIIIEEYKENGKYAVGHTQNFIEVHLENAPKGLHGEVICVHAERLENGVIVGNFAL